MFVTILAGAVTEAIALEQPSEAGFESTECGLDNVFSSTLFEEVIDGLDSCFSKPQLEAWVLTVVDDLLTFGRRCVTGFGTG